MAAAGLPWYNEPFPRSVLVSTDGFLRGEQPAPLVFNNDKVADDDDKEQKRYEGDGGDGCQRGKQARTDSRHWKARSTSPTQEPLSPRVPVCCFCGYFAAKSKEKPPPADDDNVDGYA